MNKIELEILLTLKLNGFNYIARDKDEKFLTAFMIYPIKNDDEWLTEKLAEPAFQLNENRFKFIKYSEQTPREINSLISQNIKQIEEKKDE